ncbi:peroxiredoxin [Chlamydia sp.]|uniref:peroxiredoxin n=1 Tax=Chlamydia sp. TaxID=35827 RepID=UPI0025BA745B|nr:peroxiredoxin [Chlamydia sp.]MBQ8498903.1 peroxiredoxin [Chlamydia sp.]
MGSLVGKQAPSFSGRAVVCGEEKEVSLADFFGKYVVLFFYPKDFTFVCPTELHAFQDRLSDFEERGAVVIGCSVDDIETHLRWLEVERRAGGIQGTEYPLLADSSLSISKAYGVLNPERSLALRGTFLIDKNGIVRHAVVNDLPLGRSIEEELRVLDSLIFFENHGMVCPANWQSGNRGMVPSEEGLKEYFQTVD